MLRSYGAQSPPERFRMPGVVLGEPRRGGLGQRHEKPWHKANASFSRQWGKGPWDDMLRYLQNSFSAKHNQESGNSWNNLVKAYPNPTNDIFNIAWDFSCAGQGNVELFDITGRLVLQKEFNCNSGRCELSMCNFPSGLYTYKLSLGAAMYTGKLSKHD